MGQFPVWPTQNGQPYGFLFPFIVWAFIGGTTSEACVSIMLPVLGVLGAPGGRGAPPSTLGTCEYEVARNRSGIYAKFSFKGGGLIISSQALGHFPIPSLSFQVPLTLFC